MIPTVFRMLAGISLAMVLSAPAHAGIPRLKGMPTAQCVRSANLLACQDGFGGYYGLEVKGNDVLISGVDGDSGLSWAQTSTQLGRFRLLSGVTSDGQVWFGSTRHLGWNAISRFSTSWGTDGRVSCNRVAGCR